MIDFFISIAFGLISTTYGYGEWNCGDIGKPQPCSVGAITASGEPFDPEIATGAVFAPTKLRMEARDVWMQVKDGPCVKIRINDKGNPRFIKKRGFDLSPKALELLIGRRDPKWVGKLYKCEQVSPKVGTKGEKHD